MVDIHCHILPEVDDGAGSLSEALEMVRLAAGCGVTDLAATSHFRAEKENTHHLTTLREQFRYLQRVVNQEEIPLRLHFGAEVLCTWQAVDLARERALPTLGDTGYVLCEFYFDADYDYMDEILSGIAEAGYRPVIAHPERYGAIQRNPRRVHRWFARGYVIQVNKGSILGTLGNRAQDTAEWLLNTGFVHVVASDAHSARRRNTNLSHLRDWLLHRYSGEYVRILLEENPGRLLRGEEMVPTEDF
jgi:protein-tyrosine phosphatase